MSKFKNLSKVALAAAFCSIAVAPSSLQAAEGFRIESSAFKDNDLLDRKFGAKGGPRKCDGENISPPLNWSNVPAGTKSFAFIMFDAVGGHGLGIEHWIGYGIPASTTSLAEGVVSKPPSSGNYVGGMNRIKKPFYFGPCPDVGDVAHHYEFVIIATDLEPDALPAGLDRDGLIKATTDHRLGATSIVGRYQRK